MRRVLLTGAGGFVGHHILEHLLASTEWQIVCTDSFRHKGRADRVGEVLAGHEDWQLRTRVVTHDLAAPFTLPTIAEMRPIDYIIAMASQSHVDRSISDPEPFIRNNVNVALSTLKLARALRPRAVIWMSTDEVYGPSTGGTGHAEWSPIIPSNPYAASKAAQEAIAISYWRTYGVPVQIINGMNLIGERQDPEKYLPMLIKRIAQGDEVSIHGVPGDIGSRHYLHARNLADAILHILREIPAAMFPAHALPGTRQGSEPDRWNVAAPHATSNLALAQMVAELIGRQLSYKLVDFHSARPGHDPHYGLDPAKLAADGWKPPVSLEQSLAKIVQWTIAHPEWLQ